MDLRRSGSGCWLGHWGQVQLDLQPEFDAAAFAAHRYVQKNRGQYAPAAAYRNYQFIDPFTE